ncbi:MAG TPA: hypothetical protein VNQ32_07585 [Steroidobacteraceae bacterium]|nr:hypothetical protein [Steroidobacteraceae bacterium]
MAEGGLAIHLSREVDAGQQKIAALESRLLEQQAVSPITPRPPGQAAPLPAATAPPPVASGQPHSAPTPPPVLLPDIATMRAQMSSPEAKARRKETGYLLMRSSNPGVEEALGLSAAELEKLLNLLAAQQERSSEVFDRAREQGNQASSQAVVSAGLDEHRRASEAELQELLGAKYPQWQDYERTRAAWSQGRDLRAVLDAAGTPFTPTQERAVISALAAEQRSFNQSREGATQPVSANSPERRQRRLDAAAPHLSPQQLESYREMLDRAAAQERVLVPQLPVSNPR